MEKATHRERLPYHGTCFVCGPDNPVGMGIDWFAEGTRILAPYRFSDAHQGPPRYVHGGAAAAVLDEAMGAAVWRAGYVALAANLNVDFRQVLPLDTEVLIEAWVREVDGRKAHTQGRIASRDGETVFVESHGLFLAVPDFFEEGEPGDGR